MLWLWAAALLGGVGQSLSGSAGALLAQRIGGSAVAAGLPQTVLVIGSALAALGLSRLTTRIGRNRALAVGAATAAAGALVVVVAAQARSLGFVLGGNFLLGAGSTTVMLARYAAADLVPTGQRARAMGSVLAATTIGAVAGPNLLSATSAFGTGIGLPPLTGPYLVGACAFGAAVVILALGSSGAPRPTRAPRGPAPAWSRRNLAGLGILGAANLVMVAVMTMAPVQLHDLGTGLTMIGLVISGHIAGMFLPSPVSGWLTDRFGPLLTALLGAATLVTACVWAAAAPADPMLAGSMVLLGVGWNLALLSGSALLTADVPKQRRPEREGWGETGMGIAASCGGFGSGLVMTEGSYPMLAVAGAVIAVMLLPAALSAYSASGTR
ncbi:MAG TPA: MFS transporter [Pseudonocardiaceae bacterium]|nr:MFS transporter [Pseudonocardiaceae bacterium]